MRFLNSYDSSGRTTRRFPRSQPTNEVPESARLLPALPRSARPRRLGSCGASALRCRQQLHTRTHPVNRRSNPPLLVRSLPDNVSDSFQPSLLEFSVQCARCEFTVLVARYRDHRSLIRMLEMSMAALRPHLYPSML